jgi:hypothetical protein
MKTIRRRIEMDEMKLKLSTKIMRGIVAKLISMAIKKKFGYKVDIQLNDLDINIVDGQTNVKTNVELKLDSNEFMKIMKDIGAD